MHHAPQPTTLLEIYSNGDGNGRPSADDDFIHYLKNVMLLVKRHCKVLELTLPRETVAHYFKCSIHTYMHAVTYHFTCIEVDETSRNSCTLLYYIARYGCHFTWTYLTLYFYSALSQHNTSMKTETQWRWLSGVLSTVDKPSEPIRIFQRRHGSGACVVILTGSCMARYRTASITEVY